MKQIVKGSKSNIRRPQQELPLTAAEKKQQRLAEREAQNARPGKQQRASSQEDIRAERRAARQAAASSSKPNVKKGQQELPLTAAEKKQLRLAQQAKAKPTKAELRDQRLGTKVGNKQKAKKRKISKVEATVTTVGYLVRTIRGILQSVDENNLVVAVKQKRGAEDTTYPMSNVVSFTGNEGEKTEVVVLTHCMDSVKGSIETLENGSVQLTTETDDVITFNPNSSTGVEIQIKVPTDAIVEDEEEDDEEEEYEDEEQEEEEEDDEELEDGEEYDEEEQEEEEEDDEEEQEEYEEDDEEEEELDDDDEFEEEEEDDE